MTVEYVLWPASLFAPASYLECTAMDVRPSPVPVDVLCVAAMHSLRMIDLEFSSLSRFSLLLTCNLIWNHNSHDLWYHLNFIAFQKVFDNSYKLLWSRGLYPNIRLRLNDLLNDPFICTAFLPFQFWMLFGFLRHHGKHKAEGLRANYFSWLENLHFSLRFRSFYVCS